MPKFQLMSVSVRDLETEYHGTILGQHHAAHAAFTVAAPQTLIAVSISYHKP